ncbi:MAG: phosphoribosylaminoimidazolesuccinocarboxamide synthase [Myxococcota bacterium]
MQPGPLLYQGKSKQVFATDDPDLVVVRFTDEATAFNAKKQATIPDKGRLNCAISTLLFEKVGEAGIRHHLVRPLSDTDWLCHKVEILPIEVVIRSVVAGSFARRYGLEEGDVLPRPVVEFFYKSDPLDDPLVGEDAILAMGWAERWELLFVSDAALAIHEVLRRTWADAGIQLVDAKYEFGRSDGRVLLADELTPDGARLWDATTGQKLDKDVFRRDLGNLGDAYRELHRRLKGS